MLVLTRKQGQAIAIGDDIEIVVVEVRGEQVRLGIRAPRELSVQRRETVAFGDTNSDVEPSEEPQP